MKYKLLGLVLAVLAVNFAFAGLESLNNGLNNICVDLKNILPVISIGVLVLGGVVYGGGQMLGAEMRSRASSWAQSMIIGAVIGLLIGFSAPSITKFIISLAGGDSDIDWCEDKV